MKILILGSGQVGTAVAQNLVEIPNHDVTIIDNDPEALRNIGSKLDVQTLLGNGSSPAVMAEGGAYDTDLLLALTRHDETNLAACKLASSLFNIPNDIAMQVVGVGFIIGVIQDSAETALNSSTDVLFTAAVDQAHKR